PDWHRPQRGRQSVLPEYVLPVTVRWPEHLDDDRLFVLSLAAGNLAEACKSRPLLRVELHFFALFGYLFLPGTSGYHWRAGGDRRGFRPFPQCLGGPAGNSQI